MNSKPFWCWQWQLDTCWRKRCFDGWCFGRLMSTLCYSWSANVASTACFAFPRRSWILNVMYERYKFGCSTIIITTMIITILYIFTMIITIIIISSPWWEEWVLLAAAPSLAQASTKPDLLPRSPGVVIMVIIMVKSLWWWIWLWW